MFVLQGFMWEIAPEFKAVLIFAEHRYYGDSMPFGNESMTVSYTHNASNINLKKNQTKQVKTSDQIHISKFVWEASDAFLINTQKTIYFKHTWIKMHLLGSSFRH
jgi:hypothetical protein